MLKLKSIKNGLIFEQLCDYWSHLSSTKEYLELTTQDEKVEKGAFATGHTGTRGLGPRGQDRVQPGQPRRQKVVRRPPVQLQQVGQAGRQHHRPFDSSNQAQAISAHRCGKLSFSQKYYTKCIVKKSSRGQLVYASPIRVAEKGTKQKSAIQ